MRGQVKYVLLFAHPQEKFLNHSVCLIHQNIYMWSVSYGFMVMRYCERHARVFKPLAKDFKNAFVLLSLVIQLAF